MQWRHRHRLVHISHSATMVATIYLIARLTPIFGGNMTWFCRLRIGLITLFWGSFSAVKQVDLKAMLAYSTISQLGMIVCLLGLGSVAMYYGPGKGTVLYLTAILAAVFHLINHSTFKGSLFMVVGIIDHETGTRDIRRLGGLMSLMPITFTLAIIGSFSMAGLPPFNGFLSKELFFTALLNTSQLEIFHLGKWGLLFPVVAWIASIFTFIYCMIIAFKAFMGKHYPHRLVKKTHEAPWGMLLPPILLAFLIIFFFFNPNVLAQYLIIPAISSILPGFMETGSIEPIKAWHGWTPELFMTMGVVGLGFVLFILLPKWSKLYGWLPVRITLNNIYDQALIVTERISERITRKYMTGFIRDYLSYILLFFVVALGGAILTLNSFTFNPITNSPIRVYEIILCLTLVASALLVLFARNRIVAIIGLE